MPSMVAVGAMYPFVSYVASAAAVGFPMQTGTAPFNRPLFSKNAFTPPALANTT